jgi:hypothetical protein
LSHSDVLSAAAELGTFEATTLTGYCAEDETVIRSVLHENQHLFARRTPSHVHDPAVSHWRVRDARELRRLIAAPPSPLPEPTSEPKTAIRTAPEALALLRMRMSIGERLLVAYDSTQDLDRRRLCVSAALSYLRRCHEELTDSPSPSHQLRESLEGECHRLRFVLPIGELMLSDATQQPVDPRHLMSALESVESVVTPSRFELTNRLLRWLTDYTERALSKLPLTSEVVFELRTELALGRSDDVRQRQLQRVCHLLQQALEDPSGHLPPATSTRGQPDAPSDPVAGVSIHGGSGIIAGQSPVLTLGHPRGFASLQVRGTREWTLAGADSGPLRRAAVSADRYPDHKIEPLVEPAAMKRRLGRRGLGSLMTTGSPRQKNSTRSLKALLHPSTPRRARQ